jgi:hypothetical protein
MNYLEFIARADLMVKKLFPEWHVEGTPIGVDFAEMGVRFADVSRLEDGRLAINIYEHGWDLATVEDLASVLLHEYVHVTIWDDLEETIEYDFCRMAVHEVTAYGVELRQTKLTVTEGMRSSTQIGYNQAYSEASVYCPPEMVEEFEDPVWLQVGR